MGDKIDANLKQRRKESEQLSKDIASDVEGYKKIIISETFSATLLFFIRHWIISIIISLMILGMLTNNDKSGAIIIFLLVVTCVFIYKFISLKIKINTVENNLMKDPNYYEEFEIDE